jgi:hypothetical protein
MLLILNYKHQFEKERRIFIEESIILFWQTESRGRQIKNILASLVISRTETTEGQTVGILKG